MCVEAVKLARDVETELQGVLTCRENGGRGRSQKLKGRQ